MKNLKKCSGSLDSGFTVTCPLRFNCERFLIKSIGFMQEYIKPRYISENKQLNCQDYIENGN